MIFESHAHYEDKRFDRDRERVIASLKDKGVGVVINVGSNIETSKACVELADEYDYIYAAVGVHPSEVECLNEDAMAWLKKAASLKKVVAVGEIGLDYYWDKDEKTQTAQREWFLRQLELAREVNLPVIIHSRDAAEDTMHILKQFRQTYPEDIVPGVVHCYSYSPEMAKEFVTMGYYIGIGGVVTFKNAKKLVKTVEEIGLEHLLVETDCPYMAPEPHRGERCDSTLLPLVINKIAEIKGISAQEVEQQTEINAKTVFRIDKGE